MLFAIQFEVPLLFLYHHVFSTSESENYKQHSTSSHIYREQTAQDGGVVHTAYIFAFKMDTMQGMELNSGISRCAFQS